METHKPFNHVNELNNQILNNSGTIELFRGRDGLDTIEFDGSSHFLVCKTPTGATLIKRRHLELMGYLLVRVPYWEWDEISGMDERREYLEVKLQCHVGV